MESVQGLGFKDPVEARLVDVCFFFHGERRCLQRDGGL